MLQWHYLNHMKEEKNRSLQLLNQYGINSIEEAAEVY